MHDLIVPLVAHSIAITLLAMADKTSITAHHLFSNRELTTASLCDIVPTVLLRLLEGMEALTGFVLIT